MSIKINQFIDFVRQFPFNISNPKKIITNYECLCFRWMWFEAVKNSCWTNVKCVARWLVEAFDSKIRQQQCIVSCNNSVEWHRQVKKRIQFVRNHYTSIALRITCKPQEKRKKNLNKQIACGAIFFLNFCVLNSNKMWH